jgi:general secretion pathway protein K
VTRPGRRSRGIALVLVLWVITLLSVMALGLTATQRTETTLTANALDGARFRAAADAAIVYAVLNLLAPAGPDLDARQPAGENTPAEWLPNGAPHLWTFAEVPLSISVGNETSRVDLNVADASVLAALMVAVGVPERDAAAIADRILDWRDSDNLKELNGAEDPDYEGEGLPYGAKDGPFTSVEELGQVLGVTPELYRRLAPELTVDAGAGQVDQQFASAAVLAASQGLTLDEAKRAVIERTESAVPGAVRAGTAAAQGRGGPVYRIRVARAAADTAGAVEVGAPAGLFPDANGPAMEVLVRVEQGAQPPYHVLWRRYGLAPPPAEPPTVEADQKWR